MKKHLPTVTAAIAVALWAGLAAISCQTTNQPAPKSLAARAAPGGKLEVRQRQSGATYTMSRLDLVGSKIHFDLTLTNGAARQQRRFAVPIGGSSNAWTEVRDAVKRSLDGVATSNPTLWSSTDADQWWDNPASADFMRGISVGRLEVIQ